MTTMRGGKGAGALPGCARASLLMLPLVLPSCFAAVLSADAPALPSSFDGRWRATLTSPECGNAPPRNVVIRGDHIDLTVEEPGYSAAGRIRIEGAIQDGFARGERSQDGQADGRARFILGFRSATEAAGTWRTERCFGRIELARL